MVAQRLECELVTESTLETMIATHFGESSRIPERAWRPVTASILANLALAHPHIVICCTGAEMLGQDLPSVFRFHVVAPESIRLDNLAFDCRLERAEAKARLRKLASAQFRIRRRRFGRTTSPITSFDVVVNARALGLAEMAEVLAMTVKSRGLMQGAPLSAQEAAQVQFRLRSELARWGILPPDRVGVERKAFGHPSEEVFANLLDYHRIAWDYEPRSFPLQWDKDGKVSEAFTPDFYLPEFDLYVELTTMKQANVTKKNRKIRLLRAIYPHVNIEVFYKKDVQDLLMKRRLPDRLARQAGC